MAHWWWAAAAAAAAAARLSRSAVDVVRSCWRHILCRARAAEASRVAFLSAPMSLRVRRAGDGSCLARTDGRPTGRSVGRSGGQASSLPLSGKISADLLHPPSAAATGRTGGGGGGQHAVIAACCSSRNPRRAPCGSPIAIDFYDKWAHVDVAAAAAAACRKPVSAGRLSRRKPSGAGCHTPLSFFLRAEKTTTRVATHRAPATARHVNRTQKPDACRHY